MKSSIFNQYFRTQSWEPSVFQVKAAQSITENSFTFITAPTGEGKTVTAFLPLLQNAIVNNSTLLWLTPLKALATDTAGSLSKIISSLELDERVMIRTGDTSAADKKKMLQSPPRVLVTTPESLHLLLSQKTSFKLLNAISSVVVDEWHELLSTKRGVQASLGISALYNSFKLKKICGVSATVIDPNQAKQTLFGSNSKSAVMIDWATFNPEPILEEVILVKPENLVAYSWKGSIGLRMAPQVFNICTDHVTSIIFVNTRVGAELWYESIKQLVIAQNETVGSDDAIDISNIHIHHGSLDLADRQQVERSLKDATARIVVATSSLDLGLDYGSVDAVIQIGSTKSVTRLRQRAGRSNHRPGIAPKIYVVPTYTVEILEIQALINLLQQNQLDPITNVPVNPEDVASQYLTTRTCAEPINVEVLKKELCWSYYYQNIDDTYYDQLLELVTKGGRSLARYEQFQHLILAKGNLHIASKRHAMRQRFQIGTIESGQSYRIMTGRRSVGTIDDRYAAKLQPGDTFQLGGKYFKVVDMKDTNIRVRRAKKADGSIPVWTGRPLPLSAQVSEELRHVLEAAENLNLAMIDLQRSRSIVPNTNQLLIESFKTREGHHRVIYSLAGKALNEQLATLIAHRIITATKATISFTANDFGFELLSRDNTVAMIDSELDHLIAIKNYESDLLSAQNETEVAKRRFATIARVGGLLFPGFPWKPKRYSHLTGSADMLFEVLEQFEPDHALLQQAHREAKEFDLNFKQVGVELQRLNDLQTIAVAPSRLTPLAFPIVAERLRAKLSSESFIERVKKYQAQLEDAG